MEDGIWGRVRTQLLSSAVWVSVLWCIEENIVAEKACLTERTKEEMAAGFCLFKRHISWLKQQRKWAMGGRARQHLWRKKKKEGREKEIKALVKVFSFLFVVQENDLYKRKGFMTTQIVKVQILEFTLPNHQTKP